MPDGTAFLPPEWESSKALGGQRKSDVVLIIWQPGTLQTRGNKDLLYCPLFGCTHHSRKTRVNAGKTASSLISPIHCTLRADILSHYIQFVAGLTKSLSFCAGIRRGWLIDLLDGCGFGQNGSQWLLGDYWGCLCIGTSLWRRQMVRTDYQSM